MTRNDDDDRGAGPKAAPRSSVSSPEAETGAVTPGTSGEAARVEAAPVEGEAGQPAARELTSKRKKKALPIWQEVLLLLVTAFVLALIVKTFFLQAFYIPSGSMEPTLQEDDKILVQKVSYWNDDIRRGDILVFGDPGGWLRHGEASAPRNALQRALEVVGLYPSGGHLVKRVIGIEGDTVRCCDKNGHIVVNGVPLIEDYLPQGTSNQGQYEVTVPEDRLWVLGDNRANSEDSHAHIGDPGQGFVPVDDVVGKVWAVVWPRSRMQIVDRPEVYDDPDLDSASGS